MLDICKVMGPLGIGIIIGALSTARLVEKLLKNHYKITYLIILGLLVGSVYVLFQEPTVYQSGVSASTAVPGAVTFLLGCIISFYLGKKRL
jgi:putative membrane protein